MVEHIKEDASGNGSGKRDAIQMLYQFVPCAKLLYQVGCLLIVEMIDKVTKSMCITM